MMMMIIDDLLIRQARLFYLLFKETWLIDNVLFLNKIINSFAYQTL